MAKGYMGKILRVNLSKGDKGIETEKIKDDIYKNFLCGYGLAAKILFEDLKAGIDPLGPDNILAVMSGLLTGTGSRFSGRWMAAGKSPLTGTWGDANCGGSFGPAIKGSGFDGFFFNGKSEHPVYLLIDGGMPSLHDASSLWGKDSFETEDRLKKIHGEKSKVACIGKGGERQSLISGIVTDKGRLAARSGLGAVMGSKNLKAICLSQANQKVEVSDKSRMKKLTEQYMELYDSCHQGFKSTLETWGTAGGTAISAYTGDSPIQNWKGSSFESAEYISSYSVTRYETSKFFCAECPLGCGAHCNVGKLKDTHRPEYETLCAFGTMLLNDNVETIFEVNDMLNRAGIDTISCGAVVAWAYEAFERGIITKEDTNGLILSWEKSGDSLVGLVQEIIDGEGIGKHLRRGIRSASEFYWKRSSDHDATDFAMHSGGQELPMHDPRNNPDREGLALGLAYEVEPTPGRHTASLFESTEKYRDQYERKDQCVLPKVRILPRGVRPLSADFRSAKSSEPSGQELADSSRFACFINGLGMCNFSFSLGFMPPVVDWANAATGWNLSFDEYLEIGRRIQTVRHSFNLREGISKATMTSRARGVPPLQEGPNRCHAPDFDRAARRYYQAIGWEEETGKPFKETLAKLNLTSLLPEIGKQACANPRSGAV